MTQWINVKDRLPEPFVGVLVYAPDEHPLPKVFEAYHPGIEEIWCAKLGILKQEEVAHWTEMPEGPKEEK